MSVTIRSARPIPRQCAPRPRLLSAAVLAAIMSVAGAQTLPAPPISPVPVTAYQYDAEGNPTQRTVAPGVTGFGFATAQTYDGLNRLKELTDALSGKTTLGYNGQSRITQVTDPRNLVTQSPHSGLGEATGLVSPDTGSSTFTYDAAGNLLTATDARGVLATHSYDALNRLTQVVYSQSGQPSRTLTWTYDETSPPITHGVGRLTTIAHPDGLAQFSYDLDGRLAGAAQVVEAATGANPNPVSHVTDYLYDAGGRLQRIVYPSGRVVHYGYTGGRISSIGLAENDSATPQALLSQITYQPFGAPKAWLWHLTGSATQTHERVYDTVGRLVRYRMGDLVRDLGYDAANRIVSYTHWDIASGSAALGVDQSFQYDALGRLTAVTLAGGGTWDFSHDANGNRTAVLHNSTSSAYTIASTSNRLTAIAATPAKSFSHDAVGNTTAETGTGGYSATYSLENRLATLTAGGVTTTYTYNNLGQRVRKSGGTAGSTVVYVYDEQGKLLGEYDSAGTALREYVWLGSEPVVMFEPDPNPTNPPKVVYLHTDHLGAPRLAYDRSNQLRWRWMGEPFGTTAAEGNPSALGAITISLRLPGQVYDAESGLHYNYFRDYDPRVGRYVQSDPIGLAGGVNTYTYVIGNPISWMDPYGLEWFRSWNDQTTRYAVGREGHFLVWPSSPISQFIEHCVPAGRTFGLLHDATVDKLRELGVPDWLANVPTMSLMYLEAVRQESVNSSVSLARTIRDVIRGSSGQP